MSIVATDSSTIEYNGYVFNASAQTNVQVEFVPDDAGRTIIYQKVTIGVKAIIAADEGTDDTMSSIRRKLTQQGAALKFFDQGFGDLAINAPQGDRDVRWGPVPQMLSWVPVGSSQACEIEWQVVVHVSPCKRYQGIMALNYGVDFAIDDAGQTTRSIAGYIQVAQTRVGNRIPDSADNYRNLIQPVIPLGYKRQSQSYSLSKDKSQLDFTIVDKQINSPNPYPDGVTNIKGDHDVDWRRGKNQFNNTIQMSIELAENTPPIRAFEIFHIITTKRLAAARRQYGDSILMEAVRFREALFDREHSFSLSYVVLSKLIDLSPGGGMWEPIGTDWGKWRASMGESFGSRGHSGLAHQASQDAIVDLCGGSFDPSTQAKRPNLLPRFLAPTFQNKTPPPVRSWLKYQSDIEIVENQPTVRQQILQPADSPGRATEVNSTAPARYGGNQSGSRIDDIIQVVGSASYFAIFTGHAERVGHRIPRPVLEKVGEVTAVLVRNQFADRVKSMDLGVPVYQAKWRLVYALPRAPGEVRLPENPLERTDANGKVKR